MAALFSGLETALYMTNRLKAYLEFFAGLPASLARTHFEKALVEFHLLLLQFLAKAIRTYQKGSAARAWDALWRKKDVADFDKDCNKIAHQVEIEASNCDRTLVYQEHKEASRRKRDLDKILDELKDLRDAKAAIKVLLNNIDKEILEKLPSAYGARFDSHQDEHESGCLDGTRVDLLHQIAQWAEDPKGKCIFWLCGMAGTGKSTISRTVAQSFHDKDQLGASFFFKRGEGDRGRAK
jgi:hypothetical protein